MWFKFPNSRERTLGKAVGKRRYDLPLNRNDSTRFLVILIGLMTFLAVLAIAACFALGGMAERWTSGLENKMTIEIPAETSEGMLLKPDEMALLSQTVATVLEHYPAVKTYHVMTTDEIQELVRPWLGDTTLDPEQMPLPGLISVEIKPDYGSDGVTALQEKISIAAPRARLDTHQNWLEDVLRFTGALQFAASLLIIVIGFTTVVAVSGAVKARLAVHRADVELLHLMGAADSYISRQFQRHSWLLGLTGGAAGMVAGVFALALIGWVSGEMDVNLMPEYRITAWQMIITMVLPLVIAGLAMVTAQRTVMRELSGMP